MAISNFYRGDTRQYDCSYKDGAGSPVDITTGYLFYMTFKVSLSDADAAPGSVQLQGQLIDGPAGTFFFVLASDVSSLMVGTYNYDVQVSDGAVPPIVTTIDSGKVVVQEDVTITDV